MTAEPADVAEAARLASVRLEQVARCGQELADRISAWAATEPAKIEVSISEDRLSWEARWRIQPAPLEEWGLVFGDAVHNLRASLDNLLSYIARKHGATERQLHLVQFPIVTERSKWSESQRRISMLPASVQLAVENLQPFNREGREVAPSADPLALIADFNNADKHRLAIVGTIQPQEFAHSFSVEFEDDPSAAGPPRVTIDGRFEDGVRALFHDTSPDRIKKVKGDINVRVQVVVIDGWEVAHGVTQGLSGLLLYVPQVLDAVLSSWMAEAASDVKEGAREKMQRL